MYNITAENADITRYTYLNAMRHSLDAWKFCSCARCEEMRNALKYENAKKRARQSEAQFSRARENAHSMNIQELRAKIDGLTQEIGRVNLSTPQGFDEFRRLSRKKTELEALEILARVA